MQYNILSSHISTPSANPSRTNSLSALALAITPECEGGGGGLLVDSTKSNKQSRTDSISMADEKTPLIPHKRSIPRRLAITVWNSINWVLSTLAAPGVYLLACLYDEHGNFAPLGPFKLLFGLRGGKASKAAASFDQDFYNEKLRRDSDMSASSGRSGHFFSTDRKSVV